MFFKQNDKEKLIDLLRVWHGTSLEKYLSNSFQDANEKGGRTISADSAVYYISDEAAGFYCNSIYFIGSSNTDLPEGKIGETRIICVNPRFRGKRIAALLYTESLLNLQEAEIAYVHATPNLQRSVRGVLSSIGARISPQNRFSPHFIIHSPGHFNKELKETKRILTAKVAEKI